MYGQQVPCASTDSSIPYLSQGKQRDAVLGRKSQDHVPFYLFEKIYESLQDVVFAQCVLDFAMTAVMCVRVCVFMYVYMCVYMHAYAYMVSMCVCT